MKKSIFLLCGLMLFFFAESLFAKSSEAEFYKQNVKQFEDYTLANGIPVIIKQSPNSQIVTLQISVQGGATLLKPEDSGLESVLFTMMTRGSKKYDYTYIKSLLYQKQASFSASSNQNGSTLTLTCINRYFKDFFPILADGFTAPLVRNPEYNTVMSAENQKLAQQLNTPFSLLQYTVRSTVYKGHPFEVSSTPTKASLPNITILNLKKLHYEIMNAKRITIIVSGNFQAKELLPILNQEFSFIPSRTVTQLTLTPATTAGKAIVVTNDAAKNTGFLARTFPAPSVRDADYVPALIANVIFQEILFNIVREKYGACYSVGTSIASSKSGYGLVYVYMASDMNNLSKYIAEAEAIFSRGEVINSKDEIGGSYRFVPIRNRLESFKNTQINSLFASVKTSASIANQISNGLFLINQPDYYLNLIEKIRSVTEAEVIRAFKKYWLSPSRQWFIVTSQNDAKHLNLANFQ